MLKECAYELALPLSKLFSCCLRSGQQPIAWKTANVIPIHKRESKSKLSNCRPVSLLSVMSKVMEYCQHTSHELPGKGNLLSSNQFGFRRAIGTADLLTSLHHEWVTEMGKGGTVNVLAIDIAGAFDKVSHLGLLAKIQGYSIRESLLRWLTDYLDNRKIQAVMGGNTSNSFAIHSGVPQGSMLGPTLFLLYINDAEDNLPHNVHLAVYADETTLYATIQLEESPEARNRALQSALTHMQEWSMTWRVAFEPKKVPANVYHEMAQPSAIIFPFCFRTRLFQPRTA